jgi:hypothetical protein
VIKKNDDRWITYTLFRIPRPLKQRDLVAIYRVVEKNDRTILDVRPVPDYIPGRKGVSRMEHYDGRWEFIPVSNGKTRVEFYSVAYSRPVIPRFLLDPILQGMWARSMESLAHLSEESVRNINP